MTLYQVISLNVTKIGSLSLSANGDIKSGIDYVQIIID